MPNMNHSGPEEQGPKTGRKLGKCKIDSLQEETGYIGKGMGLKRNSGGGKGKGRRLKYNKIVLKNK